MYIYQIWYTCVEIAYYCAKVGLERLSTGQDIVYSFWGLLF